MSNVLSDWTFNGVHLSSFGAVTRLDSYLDMPPKRGDNILIPMAHGKTWVPKFYDTRIVSFGIEVIGTSIIDLEQKMDALKLLLGVRTQEILSNMFCEGPRIAWAEVLNQLGVVRDPDPLVASVVVDFLLAEPFFRSVGIVSHLLTTPAVWDYFPYEANYFADWFPYDSVFAPTPVVYGITNPGTAEERNAIIYLMGPLTDVTITNITNGVWMDYTGTIAAGQMVTIDCKNFTAVQTTAPTNVIGNISHGGDTSFMVLLPGLNNIEVLAAAMGGGQIQIDFYPPYL